MKKTTFLTLLVIMTFGFFLTGCQQQNDIETTNTDSQVIEELKFLKDEGTITRETYENLINRNDIPIKWDNGLEFYPTCIDQGCDELIPREYIQNKIKEKQTENNKTTYLYVFRWNYSCKC